MCRICLFLSMVFIFFFPTEMSGQSNEPSFGKYILLNAEYRKIIESNYTIGRIQPGFAMVNLKNAHLISLTDLHFKKDNISADFNRQTFSTGARYQYRHIIANPISRLSCWAGGSVETNYRFTHFEPTRVGPTDVRLNIYTCSLYLNGIICYRVTDKIFIDMDFPYPIWQGMYRNQVNTRTDTGDLHRLADRDSDMFPRYTFNLIAGFRYRL